MLYFNGLPTVLAAVARRMHSTLAAAYFDDLPVVDIAAGRGTGAESIRAVARAFGAPPAPGKGYPPGQYRCFLGAHIRTSGAASRCEVGVEPKDATRHTIIDAIDHALAENRLHPGAASKLCGMLG